MDKAELERLRTLAGNQKAVEAPEDRSRKNMYQIRDLMEAVKPEDLDEDEELEESDDENLEESDDDQIEESHDDDDDDDEDDKEEMTETQKMREWSNSVYKQYDTREHYHEQPEGETVDLSLRRYLNAEPQHVKIEEDVNPKNLAKAYKAFKGK